MFLNLAFSIIFNNIGTVNNNNYYLLTNYCRFLQLLLSFYIQFT